MRVTSVFAVAAAMVVSVFATPQAGLAQTCQRTVSIAPQISAGEGAGKLKFAVYSGGCTAAGRVGYEVVGGAGTALPGVDFHLSRGLLQWAVGDSTILVITASIVQDGLVEANLEDFSVQLVDPSRDVLIAHPNAQGRILDDDGPGPDGGVVDDQLCPIPPTAPSSGVAEVMPWRPMCGSVEFHLSAAQSAPLTLRWRTSDGTAVAGIDYVAVVDRSQIVPAGATTVALPVQLLPSAPGSYFYVEVTSLSGGLLLLDASATFTIDGP